MEFWEYIALALALRGELQAAKSAIEAGQPTVIADPTTGGGVKTYLFGRHVQIGPIPINPA